ncbi:unnamed protein product, partial [Polarella glacialis]
VTVVNYDDAAVGEEIVGASAEDQKAYASLKAEESRHFEDQKAQTQHLGKLISMLDEHVSEIKPTNEYLLNELNSVDDSLKRLDNNCRSMTKAMHHLWHPKGKSDTGSHSTHVQGMKDDLIGLRQLIQKESQAAVLKIDAVQSKVKEVKDKASQKAPSGLLVAITQQAITLEKTVQSRGSQMSYMMICLLGSIIAVGCLLWHRMRYYERKHFL